MIWRDIVRALKKDSNTEAEAKGSRVGIGPPGTSCSYHLVSRFRPLKHYILEPAKVKWKGRMGQLQSCLKAEFTPLSVGVQLPFYSFSAVEPGPATRAALE